MTTWTDSIDYLITQALAYLMTEDNRNIILNQSQNAKPATDWVNINK